MILNPWDMTLKDTAWRGCYTTYTPQLHMGEPIRKNGSWIDTEHVFVLAYNEMAQVTISTMDGHDAVLTINIPLVDNGTPLSVRFAIEQGGGIRNIRIVPHSTRVHLGTEHIVATNGKRHIGCRLPCATRYPEYDTTMEGTVTLQVSTQGAVWQVDHIELELSVWKPYTNRHVWSAYPTLHVFAAPEPEDDNADE